MDPENEEHPLVDKNSDSGVVTEVDSEQSNSKKNGCSAEVNNVYNENYFTNFQFLLLYFFRVLLNVFHHHPKNLTKI